MKQAIATIISGFKKGAEQLGMFFRKEADKTPPPVINEDWKCPVIWTDDEILFLKSIQSKRTPVEEAMKWMIIPEEIKVNRKLQHRKNKSQRSNWRKWKGRK